MCDFPATWEAATQTRTAGKSSAKVLIKIQPAFHCSPNDERINASNDQQVHFQRSESRRFDFVTDNSTKAWDWSGVRRGNWRRGDFIFTGPFVSRNFINFDSSTMTLPCSP
jgi:hypothetical protein